MCLRVAIFAWFLCVSAALADPITYEVTVDTSSIAGTAGSLDFNFNPGPLATESANVQILNFTSDGTLAGNCPCGTGDVSGQLPSTLTFDNGTAFNDYFDDFTFGTNISFDVSLYGDALSSPDEGAYTSGSAFAFSMFADPDGTIPTLTSDTVDGYAFIVDVNLDGTTTVTGLSSETSVVYAGAPEPDSLALLGIGLLCCAGLRRQRGLAQRIRER